MINDEDASVDRRSLAHLLDSLIGAKRLICWPEGLHMQREYLAARNAVIRHLVQHQDLTAIAAETHVSLAAEADAYLCGNGADRPSKSIVRSVWSWSENALAHNYQLLRWLRTRNRFRPHNRKVRFYGLDMYGYGHDGPATGIDTYLRTLDPSSKRSHHLGQAIHHWQSATPPQSGVPDDLTQGLDNVLTYMDEMDPSSQSQGDDRTRLALSLYRDLAQHQKDGGSHRHINIRDAFQYRLLNAVLSCHPSGKIMIFEQTDHLDPSIPGFPGATNSDNN